MNMTLTTILAAGAATLALATAATYLLPRHVTVERSALVDASPEAVLALASTTEGFQRFNPYITADPDLTIEPFGPEAGVGAGFRFEGRDGTGTQTISNITADRVTYAIDLGSMGQPTQHITARPEGNQTRVTWTVESDMGLNPVFRVFGLFMDRMLGGTYESGLANIARVAA
jgi:hypothetical protein